MIEEILETVLHPINRKVNSAVDLNVSDVVLFHYTERVPVVIILKNVSDGERGTCKDAEEKCDDVYFGGDVEIHQLNIGLGGGKYCAEWAQGYSVYTI